MQVDQELVTDKTSTSLQYQGHSLAQSPYERLEHNHIRLLHLHPGTFDDPISVSLSVHAISDLPNYDALSYVWGTEKSQNHVQVNGCPLQITENLDTALRYLRQEDQSIVLWIDALAINQDFIEERNHQVQIMGSIYSLATSVVVWLGPASDQSNLIMKYVKSGAEIDEGDLMPFAWAAIKFLQQPWFWRVWVVQEVTLASSDPIVVCGTDTTTLSLLISVFKKVNRWKKIADWEHRWSRYTQTQTSDDSRSQCDRITILPMLAGHISTGFEAIIMYDRGFKAVGITYLLIYTVSLTATDARDKVYGLFGICEKSENVVSKLSPDYSKSTSQVFTETMRITILEDIRKAYFWWPLHTKLRHQLIELPSWVPDFRISFVYIQHGKDVNLEWQCTPRGYFDSSTVGANINPLVRFSEDNRILHVAGAERGRVIHLQHVAIGRHSEFCELRQKLLELLSFFHTHSIPATEGVRGLTASGDWESSAKDDLEIIIKHILDHKLLELNQRLQDMVRCEIWGKTIFVTDTGHWGATIDYVHENDIVVLLFGVNFPFILRPLPSGGFQMIDAAWISGDDWKQEFPTAEELDWDSDFSQYGLRKFDIH